MIVAFTILLISSWPMSTRTEPANWECAEPLIQKNALRPIDAELLAARITDECTRPFNVDGVQVDERFRDADKILNLQREGIYLNNLIIFRSRILSKILRLRRARDVPLIQ